jgi:adenylosuccinate synthase
MGATIVVGGQFGSEGKGKIVGYLAPEFEACVRTGGPNAGHTVEFKGKFYKLRCIPCAFVNDKCLLGIGAGAVLNVNVLKGEIEACKIRRGRLFIDPQAGIIEQRHKDAEITLKKRIGSTGEGVGAAIADKVLRSVDFRLARDISELQQYLGNIAEIVNNIIDSGGKVLIEGTQGSGLSLHHGIYPYVTSRDTTAGALCSEVGISPRVVEDIILVIRTYPIRVGGPSGPLNNEITWDIITEESGSPEPIIEKTTVTGRIRRVARFDIKQVKRAVMINRPTQIALNFIDYIDYRDRGKTSYDLLTDKSKHFIELLEQELEVPITLIGTGPYNVDIIDLRKKK